MEQHEPTKTRKLNNEEGAVTVLAMTYSMLSDEGHVN